VKVAKAIIEHSREVWLAADHTKFNRPAMVELAHLSHIDRLFTDALPPESFVQLLVQSGVECTVADESKTQPALSLVG
jgi:DeoR family glycerol-3-phosphate regulon repressor